MIMLSWQVRYILYTLYMLLYDMILSSWINFIITAGASIVGDVVMQKI